MELSKILIVGTQVDQLNPVSNRHLMADVIVLDRTQQDVTKPVLYQLKEEAAATLHHDLDEVDYLLRDGREPFILMGEVLDVDRKNKVIQLSNNNTVSYKYLVVVTRHAGSVHNPSEPGDFLRGIQTLIEALKIQREHLQPCPLPTPKDDAFSATANAPHRDLENLVKGAIPPPQPSGGLPQSDRCLYEVQV